MSLADMGPSTGAGVPGGRMTHSLSTPSGVDGTPSTPRNRGGKKLAVRVQMLDDSVTMFQVQAKAVGKVLFEQVCRQLNLLEADYFGLEYQELSTHTKYWLDLEKPLNRQVGLSLIDPELKFCVKFYTPDPAQLEEEYTRYLFCLQVKRDLATGSLQCNDNSAAVMASYIVQASCGDFVPEDYPDHTYLSTHRFVPHQDAVMQRKIMENHKKHIGQSPAQADLNLLETARRCELYGMKMHPAKDVEGVPLNLSVAHMGIAVFQGITRINTFSWAKIRKISFKRKRFLVKLHPEGYGYYKDTVEFFFDGRNECKNFWKKCVENHGFFRCAAVKNQPRRKARVLSRGSSFRYSGKTQKQIIEFVRENYVKRQTFQRSQSFRQGPLHASSRSQSHTYVNSSISANPLLPIDTAEWDRSQCSGSMTPSQMKKEAGTLDRRHASPTDHIHSQVTAAQVEIYQTKKYAPDSPTSVEDQPHRSAAGMDSMNSNRSVSPQGPASWTSPNHHQYPNSNNNSMRGQDRGRAHPGDHSTGQSHLFQLPNNNTPRRVSVGSQAYVPVSPQQPRSHTNTINKYTQLGGLSEDLNSSMRLDQEEEEEVDLIEEEVDSDLTTSTINRENIVHRLPPLTLQQQQQLEEEISNQVHYSNTNYSMSKKSLLNNNTTSTETETDNIIYTDINDICHYKYPGHIDKIENKISNNDNLMSTFNERDLYATVNRKTKTKSRDKHLSDEFIDENIVQYTLSKRNLCGEGMIMRQNDFLDNCYPTINFQYHNDLNHPSDTSSDYFGLGLGRQITDERKVTRSEHYLSHSIESQNSNMAISRNTQSLPRKSELSGVDSVDSYDSHYTTHHSMANLRSSNIIRPENYTIVPINDRSTTTSPLDRFKSSSEKLEYELSSINLYSAVPGPYKDEYDENIYDQVDKESWLKSSSCKDLYDFSYFESDKSKPMTAFDKDFLSFQRIDSPITRYDESCHSMYMPKNHSIDAVQEFPILTLDTKVYSSSYPGSTYNTINYSSKRIHCNNAEFTGSQDDISHDSYELLEKIDMEYYKNHAKSDELARSCSLDSGNYIPSDDESVSEWQKYRSAMDVKCKSAADIMNEIWEDSDDPRYLPREKLCVKSDGSFYKKVKAAMGSRTSSQESRSEFYETKISRSSDSSKKSRDSLYHTDSKKSRETSKSKTSVVSSQDSKESLIGDCLTRNYEMPTTTGKKIKNLNKKNQKFEKESSQESKSDYYDAVEASDTDGGLHVRPKVKSHDSLLTELKSVSKDSSFYDNRDTYSTFPSKKPHKTSNVHSISLQNVEIERNVKTFGSKSPDVTTTPKIKEEKEVQTYDSIDKTISSKSDSQNDKIIAFRRQSDSENIFSFDQDRIESLTSSAQMDDEDEIDPIKTNKQSPNYPLTPELVSEFDKQQRKSSKKIITRKEELMAKTHFEEYNPKMVVDSNTPLGTAILVPLTYNHATVERTKSDPNSLANRSRLCSNSRRHVLMHQKSIDLTPADSSDEDFFYKQIPSAPPVCKTRGHFEMPKNYEMIPLTAVDIPKAGFEVPKSFFREYEKRSGKSLKDDIPYVLHKRHIMNGTAPSPAEKKHQKPKSPKSPKSPKVDIKFDTTMIDTMPDICLSPPQNTEFLFTQNIDLSKVNPVTLEVDKSIPAIELSSPKRDITKKMDPKLLEKLNNKLSQIESDSATSSRTESIQREHIKHKLEQKQAELIQSLRNELNAPTRKAPKAPKPRVIPKTRQQIKPKVKGKTRITSFSSDDESLDSDDVFGSAEAIPSRLEFSPPQSRKEIEPILKIEHSKIMSAAWGRGQTMSSTEIEGSPPQCRRLADLENRYHPQKVDPQYANATELRRISERSFSIPSSEDEGNLAARLADVCTGDYQRNENIPSPILETMEFFKTDDELFYETCHEDKDPDLTYTLKKYEKKTVIPTRNDYPKSKVKLIEEMIDSSIIKRSKGHAPILFAHARLNLSEGSALASLQRQKATNDSPTTGRRAKSLDTAVISMHKLPPMNAFSSKDDTVGFDEEAEILEEKPISRDNKVNDDENADSIHSCAGSIPSANFSASPTRKDSLLGTIDDEEKELLNQLQFIEKIALQGVKIKEKKKSKMNLPSGDHLILNIPRYKYDRSPFSSGNSSRKTSPGVSRASSVESTGKGILKSPKSSESSKVRGRSEKASQLTLDGIKSLGTKDEKTKRDPVKKSNSKERPKSVDRDPRRLNRDRSKSQEETEADIAKRKERQQKLYETAMKQTITMLSPVKDQLPPFPAPEDKILVKTEGDKIIIETEFKSKAEDHVLIAKSPRKLDTSIVKISRSFDDGRCNEKIDKASRSFEDRNNDESERSDTGPEDIKSPKKISKGSELKAGIENAFVHKKIDEKSGSLDAKSDHHYLGTDVKARSLDDNKDKTGKTPPKSPEKKKRRSAAHDRLVYARPETTFEDIDMQAVISERRSLDLMKRQSLPSEETRDSDCTISRKASTADSVDSFVSVDDSKSDSKPYSGEFPHRVPTIECEEPSIEEDDDNSSERQHLRVSRTDTNRLSLDRSRSEETGSWITVECEEFIGSDLSDDPKTLGQDRNTLETQGTLDDAGDMNIMEPESYTPTQEWNIIVTPTSTSPLVEQSVVEAFERVKEETDGQRQSLSKSSGEKSRSSDSWTSGEKDVSPQRDTRHDWSLSVGKEKSSLDEESSVSCSIARPLGISQDFGDIEEKKCLELKKQMMKLEASAIEFKEEPIKSPTKKPTTPTLEKQCQIDLGTCAEFDQEQIEQRISQILQRDDSDTSSNGNGKKPKIVKPIRLSTQKRLETGDRLTKSGSDRSSQESKSSFDSKGSLSMESRGSFETESSSGSLGAAQRRGELLQQEQQATWKPFPIESSGSSSTEDPWQNTDQDTYEKFDVISGKDLSYSELKEISPEEHKESDSSFQDELNDFPATFGYPSMTSSIGSIGINPTDIIGYSTGFSMGRTLSRISERSTASEKSSMEDDISKASTHSMSMRDESVASTDHQASLSSDSRSNTNMAYISDADRRTSAEMPEIPCDSATGEKLSSICSFSGPRSPTVVTGRFSVTQVDEKDKEDSGERPTLMCLSGAGSQDSEDWPLPEIPYDFVPVKPVDSIYVMPDLDKPVPKTFCWKATVSMQSQESQEWPSPPSSAMGTLLTEDVETYYVSEPQNPDQVMVESFTATDQTDDTQSDTQDGISTKELVVDTPDIVKVIPYEDTAYLMSPLGGSDDSCLAEVQYDTPTCLSSTLSIASSLNASCCTSKKSTQSQSILKDSNTDMVIVSQPTRSPQTRSPNSEEEMFYDDVFTPGTVKIELSLSPDDSRRTEYNRKFSRGSNNSDTSIDDILSSGTFMDDQTTVRRRSETRLSTGSSTCKKCSHSSHSEEETSSLGTDLDGTVRMGLQQKKCTHSSHSEDTSIGLSISEWSTGTNTVRQYANLSGSDSLSAVSNHSGGAKSEKSNHTKSSMSSINKSTESLNEKSGSFSSSKNKFSGDNGSSDGLRYEMLSNSETDKLSESVTKSDDTTLTLTEMAHTITEWSTSSSRTLVGSGPLENQPLPETRGRRSSAIEYVQLKQPRIIAKKPSSLDDKKDPLPSVHRTGIKDISHSNGNGSGSSSGNGSKTSPPRSTERPMKIPPPRIVGVEQKTTSSATVATDATTRKRRSLELMSKLYQSQDISSDGEAFVERLYGPNEKLTQRYQSQEFRPQVHQPSTKIKPTPAPKPITTQSQTPAPAPAPVPVPAIIPKPVVADVEQQEKPLTKHHSYDDRTLSRSQIREFNSNKELRQSQSFHEQFLTSNTDNSRSEDDMVSSRNSSSSSKTMGHQIILPRTKMTFSQQENATSTDNSSPLPSHRPEKLSKCSPYYSSSLSSESPPNQIIQKPPRKSSQLRTPIVTSPPSGNDTDSSLDLRKQESKLRSRGYRKKRQLQRRPDRVLMEQESSECSEGYFPEMDSGSSDLSKPDENQYLEFDEEQEQETDEYDDYQPFPSTSYASGKFERLDMMEDVDEMGFPRYDRLSHIRNPIYQYTGHSSQHSDVPIHPVKPQRQKKRMLKREESIDPKGSSFEMAMYTTPEGSGCETKAGLSDDVCNSSEDSYAMIGSIRRNPNIPKASTDIELPYPDFLSDYENDVMCDLDIRIIPPPDFKNDSDDCSDD